MLKIDLLPRHFAVARTNKIMIALLIMVLIVVMLGWAGAVMMVKRQIGTTNAELDNIEPTAAKVEELEAETAQKQSELAPIEGKVDFVAEADESGVQYWDRFHDINEYIYDRAQVTRFSITNPSSVNFTAIVGDTTECARFVLNLIQCPALSDISISGLPAGVSIEGAGGATGGFSPMAGGMMEEPGMMGAPPMDEGMMMGGPGMGGFAPGGGGGAVTATGEIVLDITAQLTESVSEPMPPGMGGGAAGMGGGMGGGMMPPGGDMMMMEGPGMMPPEVDMPPGGDGADMEPPPPPA